MLHVKQIPLGEDLRRERDARHLTQAELAVKLAVSIRAVQNWEARLAVPRPSARRAIVAWLEGSA